jgi:alpha-tubulin suppressor-like RCC1 family protein
VASCENWENIVSVSAGSTAVLGVVSDGTVAAHFFKERDAFEAEDIHDAVALDAGGAHHAVLLRDGSVLAFGDNDCGQCDVSGWRLKTESGIAP